MADVSDDVLRTAVIIGSTRDGRFGPVVADWIAGHIAQREDMEVDLVDLVETPLPTVFPAFGQPPSDEAVAQLGAVSPRLARADAFVIVTPEYNHGYPAVLKNAMDHTFVEWHRKPIAFVSWGNVGGARAVEQLRLHAVELQMAPSRFAVHIVWGDFIQILQQGKKIEEFEHLNQAATAALDDLSWWAKVLKQAREEDIEAKQAAE